MTGKSNPLLNAAPASGEKQSDRPMAEEMARVALRKSWGGAEGREAAASGAPSPHHKREAEQALQALGYKAAEARRMIKQVDQAATSAEEMARVALRKSWSAAQ